MKQQDKLTSQEQDKLYVEASRLNTKAHQLRRKANSIKFVRMGFEYSGYKQDNAENAKHKSALLQQAAELERRAANLEWYAMLPNEISICKYNIRLARQKDAECTSRFKDHSDLIESRKDRLARLRRQLDEAREVIAQLPEPTAA